MSPRQSNILRWISVALIAIGLIFLIQPYARRLFRSSRVPPHVVLISIDTCRADYLGCYNPSRATTPNVDAFAKSATLFRNAVSPVPISLPAHASMLTGQIPPVHGARSIGSRVAEPNDTLAETLQDRGYATGAVISGFVLQKRSGLHQGFETYDDHFRDREGRGRFSGAERAGGDTSAVAIEWLRRRQDDPGRFFLFLHYFDPHSPYRAPEPFAGRFRQEPYAAEVAYADHCVGQVLDELRRLDLYDESLIIITADHGEMLGEHGELGHEFFIYQPALRVPLIVKRPHQKEGRVVDDLVGLVDVAPTVWAQAGCALRPVAGIDLTPYLEGDTPADAPDRSLYVESTMPTGYGANVLLGLVGRRWKYVWTTRPELYDLSADPGEANNLAQAEGERAQLLQDQLRDVLAQAARSSVAARLARFHAEERRRLGLPGDVTPPDPADLEPHPDKEDPKDVIGFHRGMVEARLLLSAGRVDAAVEAWRQLVKARPDVLMARLRLAQMLGQTRRHEEALEHLGAAVRLDPANPRHYVVRARTFEALRRDEFALADYADALRLAPKDPAILLMRANLLLRRGDVAAAVADLKTIRQTLPPGSPLRVQADRLLRDVATRRGAPTP